MAGFHDPWHPGKQQPIIPLVPESKPWREPLPTFRPGTQAQTVDKLDQMAIQLQHIESCVEAVVHRLDRMEAERCPDCNEVLETHPNVDDKFCMGKHLVGSKELGLMSHCDIRAALRHTEETLTAPTGE